MSQTEWRASDTLKLVRTAPAGVASPALQVAVLSRSPVTRAGLTRLLSSDSSRASVVEAPLGVGQIMSNDVVVFDLMEDLPGHLCPYSNDLAILLAEGVPVVALTPRRTSHLVETALAMGVADVVHLDVTVEGLLQAVERAAAGRATSLTAHRRQHGDGARAGTRLTDREMSVLELVGAGLPNQDIADRLYLSLNTVKTYIRLAYRKIGVTRRSQAVLWVVNHNRSARQAEVVAEVRQLPV